jgi:hypothetical protein
MTPHPERKTMRLASYDYSLPGAYFVTACTRNRELLFDALDAELAVELAWHSLLDIFANIELGELIVMPNLRPSVTLWVPSKQLRQRG